MPHLKDIKWVSRKMAFCFLLNSPDKIIQPKFNAKTASLTAKILRLCASVSLR
jgi:hypothetical protein